MSNYPYLTKIRNTLKNPTVLFVLRLLISGLLLFFLFKLAVVEKIAQAFSHIAPAYLLLFFILYFLGASLQALRWKYLLQAWDIQQKFGTLFRWIIMGQFLNNFFPGGLGGDAFRWYAGSRDTDKLENVAATVFYERVLSYGALVTLGLISLILRADFSRDRLFWLMLGSIFLALVSLFAVLSLPVLGNLVTRIVQHFPWLQKTGITNWLESFRFRIHQPLMLLGILAISFSIQFLDVFSYQVIANALGLPIKLSDLFLFVPLLYLAVLLPITLNGIGVRETVFVFFSAWWGISQPDAVAFSLTVFTLNLAGSLIGGPMYWLGRKRADNVKSSEIT